MIVAFYLMSIADVEDLSEENNKRIDIFDFLKSVEEDESSSSSGYDSPQNDKIDTVVEESPQKERSVKHSDKVQLRRMSIASSDDVNTVSKVKTTNYDNLKKPLKKFTSLHSNAELAKKKFNDLYNKISNI